MKLALDKLSLDSDTRIICLWYSYEINHCQYTSIGLFLTVHPENISTDI